MRWRKRLDSNPPASCMTSMCSNQLNHIWFFGTITVIWASSGLKVPWIVPKKTVGRSGKD